MMQVKEDVGTEERKSTQPSKTLQSDLTLPRSGWLVSAVTLLFVVILSFLAIRECQPPPVVDASAPAADFSAERALRHVEEISRRPHPAGSQEHTRVREYILQELAMLGLSAEVQETEVISPIRSGITQAGRMKNVVAKLEGTGEGKALLLAGHYDTVPTSAGASDDGSAVGTLLETARALKSGPPLQNDIIFLFTDGEEIGLLGASGFADNHAWAKDVGLVLNFEARGTNGPSLLFETSDENGRLVEVFEKSVGSPVASSIFSEIYRILPNATDMTVFKNKGYAGLNFAYIGGLAHYHALSDSVANLDLRSLQHQGSYALSLSREFGNLNLEATKANDRVFFNTIGSNLVNYAEALILPLIVATTLLFIAVLFVGFKKDLLTLKGVIGGFFAHLGALVCALVIVTLVSILVRAVHSDYRLILQGVSYNNHFYALAGVALTLAAATAFYLVFAKNLRLANLWASALLWWLLLTILSGIFAPGASYIFNLPLLFALVAVIAMFLSEGREGLTAFRIPLFFACSAPAIILSAPFIYLLALGLSVGMFRIALAFLILLVALLLPLVRLTSASRQWLLPTLLGGACAVFLVAGSLTAGFKSNEPMPTNLFYVLNADNGKAIWASSDRTLNEWTSQFIGEGATRGSISEYMPTPPTPLMMMQGRGQNYWNSQTTAAPLDAPIAEIVSDKTENGMRFLRMRIKSEREAPVVSVFVESDTQIISFDVNGVRRRSNQERANQEAQGGAKQPMSGGITSRPVMKAPKWALSYHSIPPEGFEVGLEFKASEPLKIRVVDQSHELPQGLMESYKPAPDYMTQTPYPFDQFGGAAFVSRTFNF